MPEVIAARAVGVALAREGTWKPRDHYPQKSAPLAPGFYTATLTERGSSRLVLSLAPVRRPGHANRQSQVS